MVNIVKTPDGEITHQTSPIYRVLWVAATHSSGGIVLMMNEERDMEANFSPQCRSLLAPAIALVDRLTRYTSDLWRVF
jgi:hypothetical protein